MKTIWKWVLAVLGLGLLVFVCWILNGLYGNPISHMLASSAAERHLAEVYGQTDYYIEQVQYSFKDGKYHARILSPTSADTVFSLRLTMTGELIGDSFENVTSGFNTARRLEEAYRELTDTLLESPDFPYAGSICYGTLEIWPKARVTDPETEGMPDYALDQGELELDGVYDIRELGQQAGLLVLYIDSEQITAEKAAEVLLGVRARFDEAGIPFAAVDLTLQQPKSEDGKRPGEELGVLRFPYADIREEGLVQRVEEADRARQEYFARMDELKK